MQILDHGYCNCVEHWGSDERIIEDARMSVDGGFVSWEPYEKHPKGDQGLLTRLWTSRHTSPFEGSGLKFEIQAPIFVAREWMRHRTQSYNEFSARYAKLPDLYYVPSIERLVAGKQSQKNKQGSEEGFTEKEARLLQADIIYATEQSRRMYEQLLERGLSRELSRLIIPVNQYTRFRASASLRNWLAFLELRLHPSAQWEIRQYAEAVAKLVGQHFPRTYALFNESQHHNANV